LPGGDTIPVTLNPIFAPYVGTVFELRAERVESQAIELSSSDGVNPVVNSEFCVTHRVWAFELDMLDCPQKSRAGIFPAELELCNFLGPAGRIVSIGIAI
jgi:hypothetical protein